MTYFSLISIGTAFGFLALLSLFRLSFGWALDKAVCESAKGSFLLFSVLYVVLFVLQWCFPWFR